jgi:hypothetical protein
VLEGDMTSEEKLDLTTDDRYDSVERRFDKRFFAAVIILALAIVLNGLSNQIESAAKLILSGH